MFNFLLMVRIISLITLASASSSAQSSSSASLGPSPLASVSPSSSVSVPETVSASESASSSSSKTSADALYDIYKGRLSQYQKEYEATDREFLQKDDNKRSTNKKLNVRSGNLYDEFKKRLDRFNDAVNVDIIIENGGGKRSPPFTINDDSFCGIIPQFSMSSPVLADESHDSINRDSRGFFNYFSKKPPEVKGDLLEKKNNEPDSGNKEVKQSNDPLTNPLAEDPGSIYDQYHKQLNEWTGGITFSNSPKRNERESKVTKDTTFFIWQNEDNNKKSDILDSYDIETFINQCRAEGYKPKVKKREVNYNYNNYNNYNNRKEETVYDEQIPFDTNTFSLYPLVYEFNGNIIKLSPGGKEALRTYANKLNTTAMALAKKLAKLDPRILEDKLLAAQTKTPNYQPEAPNLEAASLHVLKNILQKHRGNGRRMINIPLLRNRTILISDAVQR